MKIGVAGAGAVGSFFGGLLAKKGNEVTFLARGQHLKVMQEQFLTILKGEEKLLVKGTFTDHMPDLADADVVLFCVKSTDTIEMAKQLGSILKKDAIILTMQNGVDNEEVLSNLFGENRMLSAATYVQAALEKPGIVKQSGSFHLMIGELSSEGKDICEEVVQLFNAAGVDARYAPHILETKWSKLLWNATFNPLSAISGARIGEILDHVHLRRTAEMVCKEAIDVAIAKGLNIDSEKMMLTIFDRAEFARTHQTSMLQDRIKGKKMEVESMCGFIVKQAGAMSIHTPTLDAVYSVLKFIDDTSNGRVDSYVNSL
ncbi:ketopantoate reductase family protein [Cytobacillus purgationiresistens]|uniref:2-dehydropantoate 2-reductase n=1 Tax=Cytobacillus purgationiresistens TaxID=863449 RepID=A0ABU0AEV3_9BACI|nr:2-dehydropantoate 2-reductase [Cytobacillus purgationiresistens]MDQ0269788.1 2-dehydropantoate 2-reductase [Cytobacillus purgationiresistens]